MSSQKAKSKKKISTAEFDAKFDAGKDVSENIDWANATKRVPLDLPVATIKALDAEAERVGVPRQALIKMWIRDRLDALARERRAS